MSYSQKPLAEKLQLKPGARIRIADAPDSFVRALTLPEGAERAEEGEPADAAILFVSRRAALEARFPALAAKLEGGDPMFWIAYPKAGQLETDDAGFGLGAGDRGGLEAGASDCAGRCLDGAAFQKTRLSAPPFSAPSSPRA